MTTAEITLRQFFGSIWWKWLVQICTVIVGPGLLAAAGLLWFVLTGLWDVQSGQATRATDNERFQALITSEVRTVDANLDGLSSKVSTVKDDLGSVREDVANIYGLLQSMQSSRDTAWILPSKP